MPIHIKLNKNKHQWCTCSIKKFPDSVLMGVFYWHTAKKKEKRLGIWSLIPAHHWNVTSWRNQSRHRWCYCTCLHLNTKIPSKDCLLQLVSLVILWENMRKYSDPKDAWEQRNNSQRLWNWIAPCLKLHIQAPGMSLWDTSSCCGHFSLYHKRLTDLMLSLYGVMKVIVCLGVPRGHRFLLRLWVRRGRTEGVSVAYRLMYLGNRYSF